MGWFMVILCWLMHGLAHGPKLKGVELVEAVETPIAQLLDGDVGVIEQTL